jgi:hypothetical protein
MRSFESYRKTALGTEAEIDAKLGRIKPGGFGSEDKAAWTQLPECKFARVGRVSLLELGSAIIRKTYEGAGDMLAFRLRRDGSGQADAKARGRLRASWGWKGKTKDETHTQKEVDPTHRPPPSIFLNHHSYHRALAGL